MMWTAFKDAARRMANEIIDPKGGPIRENWNMVFAISCLVGVLTDPLFLYVPMINDDLKCIRLDNSLMIAALIIRSITDLVYIMNIIIQLFEKGEKHYLVVVACLKYHRFGHMIRALWETNVLLDIVAVLPIPQVTILVYFTKLRGWRSLNIRKFLNFLVMFQYVPRVFRIYLACKKVKVPGKRKLELRIKGGLNLLMYIVVCHIMGSLWYFFSVQRMIACWQYACRNEAGCKRVMFECHDLRTNDNIKLLNDACPINPSDEAIFNFGIYLSALESGLVGSTDFLEKLTNCLWWGLRNLSSLGSNLEPSINKWENMFAGLTSIIGLLLFLYLIGKVQMYMQVESGIREQLRYKNEMKKAIEDRKMVQRWLVENDLPDRFMTKIMKRKVEVELEENREVDYGNIESILPNEVQNYITTIKEMKERKSPMVQRWLFENDLPDRFMTKILKRVVEVELEENREVDNGNIKSILPNEVQNYITTIKEMEERKRWLVENDLPDRFMTKILKRVVEVELEENREVDNGNIESILPNEVQNYITTIKEMEERKSPMVQRWLVENDLPDRFMTKILKRVVEVELEENREVDNGNIESILPNEVQNYITTIKEMEERKSPMVQRWLVENDLPDRFMTKIMKRVVEVELEKNREVDNGNIEPILTIELQNYIKTIKEKQKEMDLWMSNKGIPSSFKRDIVNALGVELEKDGNTDFETFISGYSSTRDDLQKWFPYNRLKKLKVLEILGESVLKAICEHLKPVRYGLGSNITQVGKPLELILFVEGRIFEFFNHEGYFRCLNAPLLWGEELLLWPSTTSFPAVKPIPNDKLYTDCGATGLVLTAEDMESIVSRFRPQFDQLTSHWMTRLKNVPQFQYLDERVLRAIFLHLKQESAALKYQYPYQENQPIASMNFIIEGSVKFTREEVDYEVVRGEGDVYGAELLDWVFDESFPTLTPLATHTAVYDNDEVVQLYITAEELKSVATEFSSYFTKSQKKESQQPDLKTVVGMTVLKRVPKLKNLAEEVLEVMCQKLQLQNIKKYEKIIGHGMPVDKMLFVVRGKLRLFTSEYDWDREEDRFFGEELIDWLATTSNGTRPSLSTCYRVNTGFDKTVLLVITADDLEIVISNFKSHFI